MALLSAPGAQAASVYATSYDMVNGRYGAWDYRDFTYSPDPLLNGVPQADVNFSSLSGGLGKLTDGFIPTQSFGSYGWSTPYVGWYQFDPTITFHFAGLTSINAVSVSLDKDLEAPYPSQIAITMGATTKTFDISQDSNGPETLTFSNLGLSGSTLDLTLYPYDPSDHIPSYIMLSEVQFDGAPVPIPPTMLLLGSGLVGLVGWRRFRKS